MNRDRKSSEEANRSLPQMVTERLLCTQPQERKEEPRENPGRDGLGMNEPEALVNRGKRSGEAEQGEELPGP